VHLQAEQESIFKDIFAGRGDVQRRSGLSSRLSAISLRFKGDFKKARQLF